MEEERDIDLYLAEQEFCEEMCEEVERLYVESAATDLATSRDRGRSCLTLPWRNLSGDAIS